MLKSKQRKGVLSMLSATEKIKVILKRENLTIKDLAEQMGTSRQNLHNKLAKDNLSENDLKKICSHLGITFEVVFYLNENEKL